MLVLSKRKLLLCVNNYHGLKLYTFPVELDAQKSYQGNEGIKPRFLMLTVWWLLESLMALLLKRCGINTQPITQMGIWSWKQFPKS
jgi:hypothetical protein